MQNETGTEHWRNMKPTDNIVDLSSREVTSLNSLEAYTNGPELISVPEEHPPVSELNGQPRLPLKVKGDIM